STAGRSTARAAPFRLCARRKMSRRSGASPRSAMSSAARMALRCSLCSASKAASNSLRRSCIGTGAVLPGPWASEPVAVGEVDDRGGGLRQVRRRRIQLPRARRCLLAGLPDVLQRARHLLDAQLLLVGAGDDLLEGLHAFLHPAGDLVDGGMGGLGPL